MSRILFTDGKSYSREWMDQHYEQSQAVLAKHRGSHPLCMCTTNGIPMYIRTMSSTGRHVLARMPGTGPNHAVDCPSFEPKHGSAETRALEQGSIVEEPNGTVMIRLDVSFDIRQGASATNRAETDPASLPQDVSETPRGLGLLSLIQYLWKLAELHVWAPGMAGRRRYKQVQNRLMEAAELIHVKSRTLEQRLLIPEPFFKDQAEKIKQRRIERITQLSRNMNGRRQRFLVIGEIRKVRQIGDTVQLNLSHVGREIALVLESSVWLRLKKRWNLDAYPLDADDTEEPDLRIWGIFNIERVEQQRLIVEKSALMLTTRHYIPVFRPQEVALAYALVETGRRFIKILPIDGRPEDSPAFMLTDCGPKAVPMYITNEALPETQVLGEWYWRTDQQEIWPELPEKQSLRDARYA